MSEIQAEAEIMWPAEKIFDLIIDLRGQDRWLTKSSSYKGTQDVSENPCALGTTFREPGPFGVRNGTVTELERPTKITFHQPMTMKLHAGILDVVMRYTLTPQGESTHVRRGVTLGFPRTLRPFRPILVNAFRVESARTLVALKAYCDAQA